MAKKLSNVFWQIVTLLNFDHFFCPTWTIFFRLAFPYKESQLASVQRPQRIVSTKRIEDGYQVSTIDHKFQKYKSVESGDQLGTRWILVEFDYNERKWFGVHWPMGVNGVFKVHGWEMGM